MQILFPIGRRVWNASSVLHITIITSFTFLSGTWEWVGGNFTDEILFMTYLPSP
jgi:hypothetical protein